VIAIAEDSRKEKKCAFRNVAATKGINLYVLLEKSEKVGTGGRLLNRQS